MPCSFAIGNNEQNQLWENADNGRKFIQVDLCNWGITQPNLVLKVVYVTATLVLPVLMKGHPHSLGLRDKEALLV